MTDPEALSLIESIADYTLRSKRSGCLERGELISIGWIAYRRALETWKDGDGATLRTYAGRGVRLAIRAAVRGEQAKGYRNTHDRQPARMEAPYEIPDEGKDPETIAILRDIHRISQKVLDIREYMIVMKRIEGDTFAEIGDILGLSWQRVQQIHDAAIAKLQNYFHET